MFIQTEQTPNPATIKFIPGTVVMPKGTAEFRKADDTAHSHLAKRLLRLDGVEYVFFGRDFISVTKSGGPEWDILKTHIMGEIMQHFSTGLPAVDVAAEEKDHSLGNEIVRQIVEILDTRIRPAVAADGGDIEFEDFKDGIVYLRMKGACAGCPSSTATLKMGIENMLKHYIPEVVAVEPAPDYGD